MSNCFTSSFGDRTAKFCVRESNLHSHLSHRSQGGGVVLVATTDDNGGNILDVRASWIGFHAGGVWLSELSLIHKVIG
jgi:hypothetical protein